MAKLSELRLYNLHTFTLIIFIQVLFPLNFALRVCLNLFKGRFHLPQKLLICYKFIFPLSHKYI